MFLLLAEGAHWEHRMGNLPALSSGVWHHNCLEQLLEFVEFAAPLDTSSLGTSHEASKLPRRNGEWDHHLNSQKLFPLLLTPVLHAFMLCFLAKQPVMIPFRKNLSVFGEKISQWMAVSRGIKVEQNYGSDTPLWGIHRWQSYALACIWPEVTECYATHSLINFPFFLSGILYVYQSEVLPENHIEDSNCVLHQSEPLICASLAWQH